MSFKVRGNIVRTTIVGLTEVGEEFDLPETDFYPNTIGKVVRIMMQGSGGRSDIEMQIIQGGPLNHEDRYSTQVTQRQIQEAMQDPYRYSRNGGYSDQYGGYEPGAVEFLDYELPRDRFEEGKERVERSQNEGGTQSIAFARDPVVRSGPENRAIQNSAVDQMLGGKAANPLMAQQMKQAIHPTEREYGMRGQDMPTASELLAREDGAFDNREGRRGGYRRSLAGAYGEKQLPADYEPRETAEQAFSRQAEHHTRFVDPRNVPPPTSTRGQQSIWQAVVPRIGRGRR